jgi:glutamate-1-semialdehyde aminotransferase
MTSIPDPADIERTGRLMSRARTILAYGGLDGIVQRPLHYSPHGVFPQFAADAQGCRFRDTTGQEFIDWVIGWGPVMLGHRRPEVERAIREQVVAGPNLSLMHPIEIEVAEALVEMIPCADMVAFGKNGSDGLTAAVRLARAITGRDVILQYGMHGFHDWFVGQLAHVRGIPAAWRELVVSFPYGDVDELARRFEAHRGRVAAIVMEPVREVLPKPGYLAAVRDLAHAHGALLVFDEVMTALRLGPGGAQEAFGVLPDIACLGKSMGNGMPLSAVVGRREYMQHLPGVGFGMTFRGDTLSLAAARAVLKVVRTEPVAEHLAAIGEALRAGFRDLCRELGVGFDLIGPPARMSVLFAGAGRLDAETLRDLFLQECLKRGVFTNGNFLPCYAHDRAAVEATLAGLRGALTVVAESIQADRVTGLLPVGGFPHGPRAHIAQGFIEQMEEVGTALRVAGWMLLQDRAPDSIELVTDEGCAVKADPVQRADIAAAFPALAGAERAGFEARIERPSAAADGSTRFAIVARRGERIAFRCHVVREGSAGSGGRPAGPLWLGGGVLYV